MDLRRLRPPPDRLARRGDARETQNWQKHGPDKVREFGRAQADVSDLASLARHWTEAEELPEEEHQWSAPIHA